MSGFRGKNLRSGDLAEQLGVLLLQNVALVAPVPRTEDVGIDVVVTLLRDFGNYNYIAEDSFFVQLKSISVKEIVFKDEEVKWLSELQLPFFIALIDRKTSTIFLYSTYYLSDVLVENPNRSVVTLDLTNNSQYDCTDHNPIIKVPIGPCITSWSLETLETNSTFIQEFYQLLKSHIQLTKKSMETRRVGVIDLISWETGTQPVVNLTKIKVNKNESKMEEVIAPYFNSLLQTLITGEDILTTRSLYKLLEKIIEGKGHFTTIDGKRELIPFNTSLEDKSKVYSVDK